MILLMENCLSRYRWNLSESSNVEVPFRAHPKREFEISDTLLTWPIFIWGFSSWYSQMYRAIFRDICHLFTSLAMEIMIIELLSMISSSSRTSFFEGIYSFAFYISMQFVFVAHVVLKLKQIHLVCTFSSDQISLWGGILTKLPGNHKFSLFPFNFKCNQSNN